jgi:hypothetical protein
MAAAVAALTESKLDPNRLCRAMCASQSQFTARFRAGSKPAPSAPVFLTPLRNVGSQNRSPGVSSVAFRTRSPDLRFASLMDMDFAVSGPLVRRSRRPVRLLYASFRPRLAATALALSLTLHLHQVG